MRPAIKLHWIVISDNYLLTQTIVLALLTIPYRHLFRVSGRSVFSVVIRKTTP